VQAPRDQKELEREVSSFVSSAVVRPFDESLARWISPICPLVGGLPRREGEFILARVSQVALAAHAPLDTEHCRANLLIVVTPEPARLLKEWWTRDPKMFNDVHGKGAINSFIDSGRAVRVWYNKAWSSVDGEIPSSGGSALIGVASSSMSSGGEGMGGATGSATAFIGLPANPVVDPTKLKYFVVEALTQVLVIVDRNQLTGVDFGQLADYVAMVGLAELKQDVHSTVPPTILSLFDTGVGNTSSRGLTNWDEALLQSIYDTEQKSKVQFQAIKAHMVKSIAP
jgi:hypothetical protein